MMYFISYSYNLQYRPGLQLPLVAHTSASDSAFAQTVHFKGFYLVNAYLLIMPHNCSNVEVVVCFSCRLLFVESVDSELCFVGRGNKHVQWCPTMVW